MQISIPFTPEDLKINTRGTLNPWYLLVEHYSMMFHCKKAHVLTITHCPKWYPKFALIFLLLCVHNNTFQHHVSELMP